MRRLFTRRLSFGAPLPRRFILAGRLANRHSFSYLAVPVARGLPLSRSDVQGGKGANDMSTILLVVLILLLLGALPMWPYSSGWGYYPSGGLGLLVLILIILAVSGRL
jgi:hypothetical protein